MKVNLRFCILNFLLVLFVGQSFGQSITRELRKGYQKPLREYRQLNNDKRKVERMSRSRGKEVTKDGETGDTVYWSDFRYVPKEGFLGKHRKTFQKIHGNQVKLFLNKNREYKEIYYDTLLNNYYANRGRQYVLDSTQGNDVIGWYPGYDTAKVVSTDNHLFSILSYSFLQFMPHSGEPYKDAAYVNWNKPGFIDSLKSGNPNLKVILNVHMHYPEELHTFLSHDFPQGNLIRVIGDLVEVKGADGIEISLKNPDIKDSVALNKFIIKLADRVRGETGKKIVVLSLDPYYDETPYNIPLLRNHVDRFVIKGFDFQDVWNQKPGPFAPLNTIDNRHNINKSLFKYFINEGIRPDKVILGLPLQAPIWHSNAKGIAVNNSADFQLTNFLEYWEFKSEYESLFERPGFDYISGSAYYLEDVEDGVNLVWLENKTSLDLKFKWAKENGLAGVGLWDVSNAGNFDDVWVSVAENFGQDSLVSIKPMDFQNDKLYGFMSQLSSHRKNIGAGVVILLGFIFVAVLMCFADWRIREIFFKNYDYRLIIGIVSLLLTLIPIFLFVISPQETRIDATKAEFNDLLKRNEIQIQQIRFRQELDSTYGVLRKHIAGVNPSDSLIEVYEDREIAIRKEYRKLSRINESFISLEELVKTDSELSRDRVIRKDLDSARNLVLNRINQLEALGKDMELTEEDRAIAERVEMYQDLEEIGEKIGMTDSILAKNALPDTVTKINMQTVEVTVAEGDSKSEDFMEILCSALAGAILMYLVSLIYYKRRQNLP